MLDIIRLTILSSWGHIEWREGSTGIYGLDLMIDTNLKVWLIEVNKCPCMSYSTKITKALIPKFMEDLAKILLDRQKDPKCDIGNFENILSHGFIKEPKEIKRPEDFII